MLKQKERAKFVLNLSIETSLVKFKLKKRVRRLSLETFVSIMAFRSADYSLIIFSKNILILKRIAKYFKIHKKVA